MSLQIKTSNLNRLQNLCIQIGKSTVTVDSVNWRRKLSCTTKQPEKLLLYSSFGPFIRNRKPQMMKSFAGTICKLHSATICVSFCFLDFKFISLISNCPRKHCLAEIIWLFTERRVLFAEAVCQAVVTIRTSRKIYFQKYVEKFCHQNLVSLNLVAKKLRNGLQCCTSCIVLKLIIFTLKMRTKHTTT